MAEPFSEFAGNKRLLWIAKEWERYSDDLARWAMDRLVNRRDVWSQYTVRDGEVRVVMLPARDRRVKGSEMVTLNKLRRHFAGHSVSHLIGLHSISDHSTCKWFAVDVDLHDETVANADEIALANFTACLEWATRLRSQGMDPLLIDSNGAGGLHLWVLLDGEYPVADTYAFVSALRSDFEEFQLPRKPEVFPPKGAVGENDLPYGLRLPGRHHTRAHYSRVWNFDALGENEWLEGGEAIEVLLAVEPAPLPAATGPAKSATPVPKRKREPKPKPDSKRKPRVCVDLDGVLAKYDGWRGHDEIGAPVPGALEFARELARLADIVIFTSRCSSDTGGESAPSPLSPGQHRIRVIEWLEKYNFPYADVYIGQGKPRAAAFIDDRAVNCKPQNDANAFAAALQATRTLLGRRTDQSPGSSPKKKPK